MNKPRETHPTMKVDTIAAAQAADAAGECVAFDQHERSMAAVARHKGDTPRTDMIMGWAWQVTSPACREEMRQGIKNLERELAAANKRADEARAVAIEECKAACFVPQQDGTIYAYWPCINAISDLAILPPSHVVVPVELSDQEVMTINGLLGGEDCGAEEIADAKKFWKQIIEALTAM